MIKKISYSIIFIILIGIITILITEPSSIEFYTDGVGTWFDYSNYKEKYDIYLIMFLGLCIIMLYILGVRKRD